MSRIKANIHNKKGAKVPVKLSADAILHALPSMALVLDKTGIVQFVNHPAEKITGLSAEEVLGKPITDFLIAPGENGSDIRHFLEQVQSDTILTRKIQAAIRLEGGQTVDFEWTGRTLESEAILLIGEEVNTEGSPSEPVNSGKYYLEFENLFNDALEALFIIHPETLTIQNLNQSACHLYGYNKSELVGRSMVTISPNEARLRKNIEKILTNKTPILVETEHLTKSGMRLQVAVQASKTRYLDQPAVLASVRDETARRSTENLLRESEKRYRLIFEHAPFGILHFDDHGVIEACNPKFVEIIGSSEAQLIGFDMLHRLKNEGVKNAVIEALSGKPGVYNGSYHSVTGEKDTQVSIIFDTVRTSMGEFLGGFGIVQDVTAEKAFESERNLLYRAISQTSESIVITDPQGNINYVNPAFEKTTGFSRHEVIGNNPRILNSGLQSKEFYEDMWSRLTHGETWVGHFFNHRKDKSVFEEEASISPIMDENGVTTHYIAVKRDITKQVELEAQLKQAQKMESVGRLAGGIAHDFNNLLTPIIGYAEILRLKAEKDSSLSSGTTRILQAAERARALTTQLLAFSRKQLLEMKICNLNAVLQDFKHLLDRTIRENIKLELKLGSSLPDVRVDAAQIEHVLMNLALNAQDAMEDGGTFTISTQFVELNAAFVDTRPEVKPGSYILLSASDNGKGMDIATQSKIFEPFFTTKERGRGTGLGLATAYGIIHQHGGYIDVVSGIGKGADFRIYLPVQENSGEKSEIKKNIDATPVFGTETILIVEDERLALDLVESFLKDSGYKVLTAESGESAVHLANDYKGEIHLLITDVILTGINGIELCNRLKRQRPAIKTLYISGYTGSLLSSYGLSPQSANFIQKPFSIQDLGTTIRSVLDE